MPIFPVDAHDDPRLALYRNVPDAHLLQSAGVFVAEGRLVVRRLLSDARLTTRSLMVTRTALASLHDLLVTRHALPVYVVPADVMNAVTGFNIHRGCLALGERPPARDWRDLLSGGPGSGGPVRLRQGYSGPPKRSAKAEGPPLRRGARLVILEGVGNADNVGSIFRSASALGADLILLGPGCADPLYRKAIRTSMGAALAMPFAEAAPWPDALDELRATGVTLIALTPAAGASPLAQVAAAIGSRAVAILVGHEGDGLSPEALARCEYLARIPIRADVDSLNVATAAAIALYELRSDG